MQIVPSPTPNPAAWPTPTPIMDVDAAPTAPFDVALITGQQRDFSEGIVSGYNYVNSFGVVDTIIILIIIGVIFRGFLTITKRLRKMTDNVGDS